MSFFRLRDLIRAVRCCKTAADERSVIQRESAYIRTSFKEDDSMDVRYTNVGKMLYIHLLGYPAHFGQLECLKLVASSRYSDKRLGYLGIMLLLDENQQILTLVTNSLKNDMNSANMYVVGLALCTLGNIASVEVATDLVDEVERLMESPNTYIRKKAALCALRIVRKVPDLRDSFVEKAKQHLVDKNPGVLLSGIALASELCLTCDEAMAEYRMLVPKLVKQLKGLLTAGYSPEYDVSGVSNPFLQVSILRLLRILGQDDPSTSEVMNDILTQVATNTDSSKNVGMSILYETAVTVLDIQSDSSLRVLAINILGKFLANRDNNIRYVALATLTRAIATEGTAVQRHRNTILECLHDVDISIRRRALHLAFALIQPANVRIMVRELLSFLEVADSEFKPGMTSNICAAAERFAPNRRWQIDTVIRVFQLAGNYVKEENLYNFLALVANQAELHAMVVHKLFALVQKDQTQLVLVQAAVWTIGEFGDLLWTSVPSFASPGNDEANGAGSGLSEEAQQPTTPDAVVDLLANLLRLPYTSAVTREMTLTALVKLSDRLQSAQGSTGKKTSGNSGSGTALDLDILDSLSTTSSAGATADKRQGPTSSGDCLQRIRSILGEYTDNVTVELQQRAVEYSSLFKPQFDGSRAAILERMPVPEYHPEATVASGDLLLGEAGTAGRSGQAGVAMKSQRSKAAVQSDADLLMDLVEVGSSGAEGLGSASMAGPSSSAQPSGSGAPAGSGTVDLLADLFGDTSVSSPSVTPAQNLTSPQPAQSTTAAGDLLGLLGSGERDVQPSSTSSPLGDLLGGGGSGGNVIGSLSPSLGASSTTDLETAYEAYNKQGLRITLTPSKDTQKAQTVRIQVAFTNQTSDVTLNDLLLLVAVPKSQVLHMDPPSATRLSPGETASQFISVHNPTQAQVRLRLKVVFSNEETGVRVDDIVQFSGFPKTMV
ncbi:clathrin associated protein complex large subunit [Dispira parvispora]|uniref:AP-1 complex subunit gamma n=1 Tax=Dispira parvispora TaxID=1520584 RepID=A0A9W8AXZ2_9FUNG|nr:clathrin associated protein complex large subunit [Dispira parvispora]